MPDEETNEQIRLRLMAKREVDALSEIEEESS